MVYILVLLTRNREGERGSSKARQNKSMAGVRCGQKGQSRWSGWVAVAFILVAAIANSSLSVSAQTQEAFISYACGAPNQFTSNGISWDSDASVAPGGKTRTLNNTSFRFFSPFNRSDPQQNTNCFNQIATVSSEGPVLLRVTYQYLNYDSLNSPPKFDMWVGTTKVATVDLARRDPWTEEVIYSEALSSDARAFCLVALEGAPVLSYLELRPLPASSYKVANDTIMLRRIYRLDCGNKNVSVRYPDDPYDRIWNVDQYASSDGLPFMSNATLNDSQVPESPPYVVLQTSRELSHGTILSYNLEVEEAGEYHVKLYFADLIGSNNSTTFNVLINKNAPVLVKLDGLTVTKQDYSVSTNSTINITLQQQASTPEISALEVFKIIPTGPVCPSVDVLKDLKGFYGLNQLDWVHDPCLPTPWKGIMCTDSIVTSLDLSNMDLMEFGDRFADLTGLTYLNLSNNRLYSQIPDLSQLTNLEVLALRNNNLFGTLNVLTTIAATLKELDVSYNPSLFGFIPSSLNHTGLAVDIRGTCIGQDASCLQGSPPLSSTSEEVRAPESSKKKSHNIIPIIGGVAAAVVTVVVGVGLFNFCCYRKKSPGSMPSFTENEADPSSWDTELNCWTLGKTFTYKELAKATNHFKQRLGQGSFGAVYFGKLANKQEVAVKMRSDASQIGENAFINEVYLLSRVHHPNLVSLLGHCTEKQHQLIVYEYMAGGTLSDHLHGSRARLNWADRLQIAVGSATGIVYLHNESDPKIIHRDVKSNNILLDESMCAKVSDFGLSKLFVVSEATHVTTIVKGTAGYLDPEYFTTQKLTEKSDVYSFGVVLLELLSGREPLKVARDPQEHNLVEWAKPHLLAGRYSAIVDPKMENTYKQKTVHMVARLALHCIHKRGAERPTMLQVLRRLEEALALEGQGLDITSSKTFRGANYESHLDSPTTPLTRSSRYSR